MITIRLGQNRSAGRSNRLEVAVAVPDLGERPGQDEQQDAVHEDRDEPPPTPT